MRRLPACAHPFHPGAWLHTLSGFSDRPVWLVKQAEVHASEAHHLRYFHKLYQVPEKTEALLTDEYMKELAAYVHRFDHVYASGIGKSCHAAELLENLSWKNGQSIHAIRLDFAEELCDFMGENDLLIIFSVSGRSSVMNKTANANGKILLITTNPLHKNKEIIDRAILIPASVRHSMQKRRDMHLLSRHF